MIIMMMMMVVVVMKILLLIIQNVQFYLLNLLLLLLIIDHYHLPGNRVLHEIELFTPVRYSRHDQVEPWLNGLLCLNTGGEHAARECPYPSSCELYYVNKDTLFSGHEKTEEFLQELISVFAASHYKVLK